MKSWLFIIIGFVAMLGAIIWTLPTFKGSPSYNVGQQIDSFNGVAVYYNGKVSNVSGRNTTAQGYNLGLKYQCVEFVKRYYYQHLNHKMPDSYGHAKDFFDKSLQDGKRNKRRNLVQYTNPSKSPPKVNDLLVFDGWAYNGFGHVAIVSAVKGRRIEIIQQNAGPNGKSRVSFALVQRNGQWEIKNNRVLGWLRKE
jgi:surface antigen